MDNYRYFNGAPGVRCCIAVHPTFVCPYSQLNLSTADEEWEVPAPLLQAATQLGMYPGLLVRLVVRGHRNNRRMREGERLTDRCENCGARMERRGFHCWIEQDKPREHYGTSDRMTEAIGGTPKIILKTLYLPTKKEAREWAFEESKLSKNTKE